MLIYAYLTRGKGNRNESPVPTVTHFLILAQPKRVKYKKVARPLFVLIRL
jgi:hypothetical protein